MNRPGLSTQSREKISAAVSAVEELYARVSRRSLADYLSVVRINAQPQPRQFGQCAEPWQVELLRPKIPAFEYLAGLRDDYTGPLSFFDVLARGHDKSSLEGRLAVWLLTASKRIIHGYIVAADRDQGRLILQAIEDETRLNPWLARQIEVQRNVVRGPAGDVEVLPADAASAYGLRGNFFVCDEVTHWKNQRMWNAIFSGRQKVSPSILCVLSNAGLLNSWQHEAYKKARARPNRWAVFAREGFLASWVNAAELEDMRSQLPPSEARRLYDNKWIDPAEDKDYLRREEVERCENPALRYRLVREVAVNNYIATVDYGPKRDRTALCVMHQNAARKAVIDRLDVWQGSPESPVTVERVQGWIAEVARGFRPRLWVVDPHQMQGTIEWMADKQHLPVEPWAARAGQANMEMAMTLRSMVVSGQVEWYPGCGRLGEETLTDELCALVTKRMPYGFKFDHENQRHDDRAVALAMGLVRIGEFPAFTGTGPARGLAEPEVVPLAGVE